jgi:hypothetical protein
MEFYTYLWLRDNLTPYYVGKGSGKRAWLSHKGHRPPNDLTRILILHQPSEQEAFNKETELIAQFGRKDLGTGCLRNMTDGGDGVSGHIKTTKQLETCSKNGKATLESGHLARIWGLGGHISGHNVGRIYGRRNAENGHMRRIQAIGASLGARAANHLRWHVKRGVTQTSCSLCTEGN